VSKRSDQAKVLFIIEMIERVEMIVARHHGIVNALEDQEGELALFMAISQIGEGLQRLGEETLKAYALHDEKKFAYATRNYIVHDYDGVDKHIIEEVIRTHLPLLKEKLSGTVS